MQYLEEFKQAINNKQIKNKISCICDWKDSGNAQVVRDLLGVSPPDSVIELFLTINGLLISKPRHFQLLKLSDTKILEDRYLLFAIINENELICFDMSSLNAAGEWDIINHSNGNIITKTLASFLTNKIWAWVDRSRTIWKEESYT